MSEEEKTMRTEETPETVRENAEEGMPEWKEEGDSTESEGLPRYLVIPQRDLVVFNEMVSTFEIREEALIEEVKAVMMRRSKLFLVLRMNP
ncbi:MAG: hypothetical protein J5532_05820, partial [Lachnospiraceae bacterium]|nr:hypothetical protein [Lachnospiraceae bacterium]